MDEKIFYVSNDGNDYWSGSFPEPNLSKTDGPFLTLPRARDSIREYKQKLKTNNQPEKSFKILVRGGKYFLAQTLILGPEDSGTRDHPVIYQAFPGEIPILSAGRLLENWYPYTGKILQSYQPETKGGKWKIRQLFFSPSANKEGTIQPRSRYPKSVPDNPLYRGWAFTEGPADDGTNQAWKFLDGVGWHMNAEKEGGVANAFHCKPGFFPRHWSKPNQGEVCIFLGFGWGYEILPIETVDESSNLIKLQRELLQWDRPQWYTAKSFSPNARFIVENMIEDLTEPGEWCLDSEDGILYWYPPEGNFTEGEIIAPRLHCLLDIRGASWITLSGFTFTETQTGDDMLREDALGYGAFYPHQGLSYCGEALRFKRTEHCIVERCSFYNLGGNAIYLDGYNFHNSIKHNNFHHIGANGICIFGNQVQHPLFNEVTDNEITQCGLLFKLVAGVYLGASNGNLVSHNYIHHMPHHAINLGSNGLGRNIIEYNEIRYIAMESMDTGAINSWGDVPIEQPARDAERCGHVIRYNLITDPWGCHVSSQTEEITAPDLTFTNGIYLDDYTSNCFVYGNVVIRSGSGIMIHGGKNNFCENNIFIDCYYPIRYFDSASERLANWQMPRFQNGNVVQRNIILATNGRPVIFNLGYQFTDKVISFSENNLFWNGTEMDYFVENPGKGERYSLVEWQDMGYDRTSRIADPEISDLNSENFMFHASSPALELGIQPIDLRKIGIRKP
jgi:parallel beta-helix repeat protein